MSNHTTSQRAQTTQFDHFILTRFNVRGRYYAGDPGDDWLRYRVALFEQFTLPSLVAQTVRDYRWLVLVDSESPDWFCREVEHLGEDVFEVVYVEGTFNAAVASGIVRDRLGQPHVLTTRLDNDDAVAVDFVETIHRAFVPGNSRFINLVNGAQLAGGRIYRRPYTQNPFVTLAEPCVAEEPSGVFVKRHFEVSSHAPVLNLRTRHPMWLQVVHGGNVLTELVGLRTPARSIAPWFGCQLPDCDRPGEFVIDYVRGALRTGSRMATRPRRFIELAKAWGARRTDV